MGEGDNGAGRQGPLLEDALRGLGAASSTAAPSGVADPNGYDPGGQRFGLMHGSSFVKARTAIMCPTRGGANARIHHRVYSCWMGLMAPPNQGRLFQIVAGDEVGIAYNNFIAFCLQHPDISQWEYVMTVEDDNLVPPDAHIRLIESITDTGCDAVSGIYFTKGEYPMPMAYGDPDEFRRTGKLDFRPRTPVEIGAHLQAGGCMEVNGIAMGCALWKMDLFRQVPPPWFQTIADITPKGPMLMTQDLAFCEKAKYAGKRFAVDFRVRVGHLDVNTGVVY